MTSVATTLAGERANPHPSQAKKYEVEVIDQAEGEVCVRYVSHTVPPWWITEEAWRWWKAHTT